MTITICIATRNRAQLLQRCLESLRKQSSFMFEIIVVDNNSTDTTKKLCLSLQKILPLRYIKEINIGLPYVRNTGIQLSHGEITAFIDDDCIASKDWIKTIIQHFYKYPDSLGLIGKNNNADPTNVASAVEEVYHYRWLRRNVTTANRTLILQTGNIIDFKNAAFRSSFIKKFKFSKKVPYGDVGNEDTEIGHRLFATQPKLYYCPRLQIYHSYSTTIPRMLYRNFWEGFANQILLHNFSINLKKYPIHYPTNEWIYYCWNKLLLFASPIHKLQFIFFLLVFPFSSKIGRFYAFCLITLSLSVAIPQRGQYQ